MDWKRTHICRWARMALVGMAGWVMSAHAQSVDATASEPTPLSILRTVTQALEALQLEEKQLQQAIVDAVDDATREDLSAKLEKLRRRIHEQEQGFESVALNLGSDLALEDVEVDPNVSLQDQFSQLVQPLIGELQSITERPRATERLRNEITAATEDIRRAEAGLEHLEMLLDGTSDGTEAMAKRLQDLQTRWQTRLSEAESQRKVAEVRLKELSAEQGSVFEFVRNNLKRFFLTRGFNLLLAAVTLVVTFFGLRWVHDRGVVLSPWHKKKHRGFAARMFDVIWLAFSMVGAVVAALGILYLTGDWVLLGVCMLAVLAGLLAAKSALPRFYNQARLLLNVGEVREGERLVLNGVPWLVETINLYTWLENPAFDGVKLRVPLEQLVGLTSRPHDPSELWFPAQQGHWVLLSDGSHGKVVEIGPEYVQVVHLGGARTSMTTAQFNEMAPQDLSLGFRVTSTFGVDYKHQPDCLDLIPATLSAELSKGLIEKLGVDAIKSLKVEFAQAGGSSLDYSILADFDGEVASQYQKMGRLLQMLAVQSANRHGWVIPFQQVVVHQA